MNLFQIQYWHGTWNPTDKFYFVNFVYSTACITHDDTTRLLKSSTTRNILILFYNNIHKI